MEEICREASELVERGVNIIILSDRNIGPDRAPMPSLLATAAVHHHLVREGTRLKIGLVAETGEAREIHHLACLIGYGNSAVNPYILFESVYSLHRAGRLPDGMSPEEAEQRVVKAIGKGLLKVLSKMGISTIRSYTGAQIFEAVGLEPELVNRHFTGTSSRIGGVGLDVLAREALDRHARAYPAATSELLPSAGIYQWRRGGVFHGWNPETIASLQHAARNGDGAEAYERFARYVNHVAAPRTTLRGLLRFRDDIDPLPLDEVEPAIDVVRRFKSGGMSLGALSPEAHETLAVGMNRLGGKSNTGEGGEDPARFDDERRSSIKQVASGRFGVTVHYLANADELQIKVAQGAKPGEGGQLPGHKVDRYIAGLRFSTPGVTLISPPPHHDIYSIEDLKQLIYDLRCANPRARVSVKLVSEVGVGTIAAGVAKANADHVVIAGHDGGTGASPQASIQHAGIPWEIGLAETQQTLLRNDLRSRILVEVDGQMRTGRDVVIGAILGADEFGFSTAPLIALGCVMMRVCHLNTCPVGVATQDPELRERFEGKPEHVVNYLFMVAEEARGLMASLGVRSVEELIGRTDLLAADEAVDHWKARGIDLRPLLVVPDNVHEKAPALAGSARPSRCSGTRSTWTCSSSAARRSRRGAQVRAERPIENKNRAVGGLLSGEIARRHGAGGPGRRAAWRSCCAARPARASAPGWRSGVSLVLEGDANDYVGQGPVRRLARGAPAGGGRVRGRGERDRGQRGALRRHERPRLLPRARRRALRGPQLRSRGRGRGRGRPRLRVHDRRARRGARRHGPQLRRRHERRHRLRARRGRRLPLALQHRARGLRRDHRRRLGGAARRWSRSTSSAPARRWPPACSRAGTRAWTAS